MSWWEDRADDLKNLWQQATEAPQNPYKAQVDNILNRQPGSRPGLEAYLRGEQVGRMAPYISEAGAPQIITPATPAPTYAMPSDLEKELFSARVEQDRLDRMRAEQAARAEAERIELETARRHRHNATEGGRVNLGSTSQASGYQGFATGGEFNVQGPGGVDSQLVAFKATPGERVIVLPPPGGPSAPQSSRGGLQGFATGGAFTVDNNMPQPINASSAPRTLDPNQYGAVDRMTTPGRENADAGQYRGPVGPQQQVQSPFGADDPGFRQGQHTLRELLTAQAQGQGPSLADQTFANAKDQLMRQQLAMAAGNRTNPALAARTASLAGGQMGAQLAGQAAAARLDERQRAQGVLSGLLGTARSQDQRTLETNLEAQLRQQDLNLRALRDIQSAEDQRLATLLGVDPQLNAFQRGMGVVQGGLNTWNSMGSS